MYPNNDLDGRASSASNLVGRASPDADLDGRGKQLLVTQFPDGTLNWRGLSVTAGRIKEHLSGQRFELRASLNSNLYFSWYGEGIQAGTVKESSQTYS